MMVHSLKVLDHEHIAAKDWDIIVFILKQIAYCLNFMHRRGMTPSDTICLWSPLSRSIILMIFLNFLGVIHGDLKPLNIMRTLGRYMLIDMDASVSFFKGEYSGTKAWMRRIAIEEWAVFIDAMERSFLKRSDHLCCITSLLHRCKVQLSIHSSRNDSYREY
jgi:serine/threonine protein kinase